MPDPEPVSGKLVVEPLAAGICGSDLHLRQQMQTLWEKTPADARDELPKIVPGHEFSARIVAVGPDVDDSFKVGMRVTANPFTEGAAGRECIGLSRNYSGGIATLSRVDAARAVSVPDSVPDSIAALTEPLAVAIRAVDAADRNPGPNLVIGCGPVGLAVIFALRVQGRGPIVAADFSATRRAAAAAMGADEVIDPAETSPYECWSGLSFEPRPSSPLLEDTLGRVVGANIFECVGVPGMIDQVTTSAPQHAHVIVVGSCNQEDKFIPQKAIVRELTLEFIFAYRMSQFRTALQLLGEHTALAEQLITSELPLSQTQETFDLLGKHPEQIKVLIRPQQ